MVNWQGDSSAKTMLVDRNSPETEIRSIWDGVPPGNLQKGFETDLTTIVEFWDLKNPTYGLRTPMLITSCRHHHTKISAVVYFVA